MNSLDAINLITADLRSKTEELLSRIIQLITENVLDQQRGVTKEFASIPAEWFDNSNHFNMIRVELAKLNWDLVPQPSKDGYPNGYFRLCPFFRCNGVTVVFS
jgi:hypothetical protein